MTVPRESIEAGKCYLMETGRIRQVMLRPRRLMLGYGKGKSERGSMTGVPKARARVNVILNTLVDEGVLTGFRTNFSDQGPIWVPTVTIHPAEGTDLAAVLERVEKALRPLGVSEVVVEGFPQEASDMLDAAPVIRVGHCYLTSNGQVARVLEVSADGKLRYEFRSVVIGVAFWTPAVTNLRSFIQLVEQEIPCDLALAG